MKVFVFALLVALACASTQRYIIHYDDEVFNALHLNSLPDNTVTVLQHLKMVVADMNTDEISMFESVPGVTVHKDGEMSIYGNHIQENPKNWGLDRIDQHDLPLDQKFHYNNEGEGVEVYVIDTGVQPDHVEFGGRAIFEKNFAGDSKDVDCNGHGTHVSSTIGGVNVGIAKKARIHGIKVLGCEGSGSFSGILGGINYVVQEQLKNQGQKSIINMSLGGGKNFLVNFAVEIAVKAGITVVVAAGNSNEDACTGSPSSAPNVITVAASHSNDTSAWFTNWGKCVDIYAPGVDIYGAWFSGNEEYKSLKGTSMASPHVAGVATLILSAGVASSPAEVKAKLVEVSSKNVINSAPADTTTNLLYADPSWGSKSSASFLRLNQH
jgi:serine protease